MTPRGPFARLPGSELVDLLGSAVPVDTASQRLADHYIYARVGRRAGHPWRVLDLGCGAGGSLDAFRREDPTVEWTGLDIEGSPEVEARTRTDASFVTFDGERIPFEDESFDLVFCKQVLEHVSRLEPLLGEVTRCLSPGGWFAGSTSQLEPYHSRSTQNPTPYGLAQLLAGAGMDLRELRPGIDGPTIIARRLVARPHAFDRWWATESPLNRLLELAGRAGKVDVRKRNAAKLLLCGQFTFLATRTQPQAGEDGSRAASGSEP